MEVRELISLSGDDEKQHVYAVAYELHWHEGVEPCEGDFAEVDDVLKSVGGSSHPMRGAWVFAPHLREVWPMRLGSRHWSRLPCPVKSESLVGPNTNGALNSSSRPTSAEFELFMGKQVEQSTEVAATDLATVWPPFGHRALFQPP